MASNYKPSPLSFNSPRSSPFHRPSSPSSPTTVIGRPSTPPSRNGPSPMTSPSKLKQSFTAADDDDEPNVRPRTARSQTEPPASPTKNSTFSVKDMSRDFKAFQNTSSSTQSDNLTKLPPQLLHSMREAFSVLDSNSTGFITPGSVMETLLSLGLQDSINPSSFFPPNQAQQISLPQFLNSLANVLVTLSPQQELLNAFSAFDDDDSGQVDIAELRDALLNTAPDPGERPLANGDVESALEGFSGRRVFARNAVGIAGVKSLGSGPSKKNGDVFRYQDFVGNLTGGPTMTENVQAQPVPAR